MTEVVTAQRRVELERWRIAEYPSYIEAHHPPCGHQMFYAIRYLPHWEIRTWCDYCHPESSPL